jgi:hypothetical protein
MLSRDPIACNHQAPVFLHCPPMTEREAASAGQLGARRGVQRAAGGGGGREGDGGEREQGEEGRQSDAGRAWAGGSACGAKHAMVLRLMQRMLRAASHFTMLASAATSRWRSGWSASTLQSMPAARMTCSRSTWLASAATSKWRSGWSACTLQLMLAPRKARSLSTPLA